MTLDHYVRCKSNMAPNMAANTSIYSTVHSNLMILVSILSFLGTMNTFRLNDNSILNVICYVLDGGSLLSQSSVLCRLHCETLWSSDSGV